MRELREECHQWVLGLRVCCCLGQDTEARVVWEPLPGISVPRVAAEPPSSANCFAAPSTHKPHAAHQLSVSGVYGSSAQPRGSSLFSSAFCHRHPRSHFFGINAVQVRRSSLEQCVETWQVKSHTLSLSHTRTHTHNAGLVSTRGWVGEMKLRKCHWVPRRVCQVKLILL